MILHTMATTMSNGRLNVTDNNNDEKRKNVVTDDVTKTTSSKNGKSRSRADTIWHVTPLCYGAKHANLNGKKLGEGVVIESENDPRWGIIRGLERIKLVVVRKSKGGK
jgi:hypothetical protein